MVDKSSNLDHLREKLTEHSARYLSADIASQRLSVATALSDVAKYLEAEGFSPDTLLPIMRPTMAIIARENNAVDQMFCQRERDGRPSAIDGDHMRAAIMAVLANACLSLHHDDGRTQAAKLAEAARNMHGPWFGDVTSAKLKAARALVSCEAKDHVAVEFFNGFTRFYAEAAELLGRKRAFPLMIRYVNEHPVSYSMGISKTPTVS